MKINRNPLPELPDERFQTGPRILDQIFRAACAATGSLTTPAVKQIADCVEQTYHPQRLQRVHGRPRICPRRRRAKGVLQAAQFAGRHVCLAAAFAASQHCPIRRSSRNTCPTAQRATRRFSSCIASATSPSNNRLRSVLTAPKPSSGMSTSSFNSIVLTTRSSSPKPARNSTLTTARSATL